VMLSTSRIGHARGARRAIWGRRTFACAHRYWLTADEARASLRFSLGRHTTAADIQFALEVVPAAVEQLRELSPTYRRKLQLVLTVFQPSCTL